MNRKIYLLNFLFLFVIVSSIVFVKQFMDNSVKENVKNDTKRPDAYLVNAHYLRTNSIGKPDVALFSPYVTHYKTDDTSFYSNPHIYLYKNGDQWRITSKTAKGVNGVETFYLYNGVTVKQLPSSKGRGTLLSTDSLTVFPKKDLVTTQDFVTIEQPGLKITAKGLKGDLKTGNIQLLSKTRGQYDPQKAH